MNEPKYTDGKYHVERLDVEDEIKWAVVNIYGEVCIISTGDVIFTTKVLADKFCARLNLLPEGGVIRNLI
jgi:hypothetical protein